MLVGERLDEFLAWAAKVNRNKQQNPNNTQKNNNTMQIFEISICSLGEQSYVNEIVEVIDPTGTRIRGVKYSCRKYYTYSQ